MFFDRITIGLERPKDWANGQLFDFREMRKAIYAGQRDSALINQVMRTADYNGLSAEDRYTLLAYEALIVAETYWKMALDTSMLNAHPPFILQQGPVT